MKKGLSVLLVGLFLFVGCGGLQLSDQQEDALAKAGGNALGIVIGEVRPEIVPVAREFCEKFLTAQDLAESQKLFDNALNFLSRRYTEDTRLGKVLVNALTLIGINELQAAAYLDRTVSRLDPLTKEMLHKALLVVGGVCEVM